MSFSTTSGIPGVPDGITLFTDSDGCKQGCYVDVGLSDGQVISGTLNQADFVLKMFNERCKGSKCYSDQQSTENTESYKDGREDLVWFDGTFKGTVTGDAATDVYMQVLKESALGALRHTGRFETKNTCNAAFPLAPDPDNSMGCDPHTKEYGHMTAQVVATMYDVEKDKKGDLTLTFALEENANGFCSVINQVLGAIEVLPLDTAGSTALGVGSYLINAACS